MRVRPRVFQSAKPSALIWCTRFSPAPQKRTQLNPIQEKIIQPIVLYVFFNNGTAHALTYIRFAISEWCIALVVSTQAINHSEVANPLLTNL